MVRKSHPTHSAGAIRGRLWMLLFHSHRHRPRREQGDLNVITVLGLLLIVTVLYPPEPYFKLCFLYYIIIESRIVAMFSKVEFSP